MEMRERLFVASIWIAVAALMAVTIGPGVPSTVSEGVRLFVVALALLLAVVYLFDPWGAVSRQPFH